MRFCDIRGGLGQADCSQYTSHAPPLDTVAATNSRPRQNPSSFIGFAMPGFVVPSGLGVRGWTRQCSSQCGINLLTWLTASQIVCYSWLGKRLRAVSAWLWWQLHHGCAPVCDLRVDEGHDWPLFRRLCFRRICIFKQFQMRLPWDWAGSRIYFFNRRIVASQCLSLTTNIRLR